MPFSTFACATIAGCAKSKKKFFCVLHCEKTTYVIDVWDACIYFGRKILCGISLEVIGDGIVNALILYPENKEVGTWDPLKYLKKSRVIRCSPTKKFTLFSSLDNILFFLWNLHPQIKICPATYASPPMLRVKSHLFELFGAILIIYACITNICKYL